jgi:hypothetical protein
LATPEAPSGATAKTRPTLPAVTPSNCIIWSPAPRCRSTPELPRADVHAFRTGCPTGGGSFPGTAATFSCCRGPRGVRPTCWAGRRTGEPASTGAGVPAVARG